MKKNLLILSTLVLGLVASCGSSTNNTTTDDVVDSTVEETTEPTTSVVDDQPEYNFTKPVTINFWQQMNEQAQNPINDAVASFQKIYPNVTVNNVKQSASYQGLRDMIVKGFAADNYPDIAYGYPDHFADYINYGKAYAIDPYMDNPQYGWTAESKADIVQAYLEEGQDYAIEGTFSLPFSKSSEVMYYNKTLLPELAKLSNYDPSINDGNPINDDYLNKLTWEELFEKIAPAVIAHDADPSVDEDHKLLKAADGTNKAVVAYDSDDNFIITLCAQYGLDYTAIIDDEGKILFNNPEVKAKIGWLYDLAEKGYLITKGSNGDAYTSDLFKKGACLFTIGSTGGTKNNVIPGDEVGVVGLPQADESERVREATINQGPGVAFLEQSSSDAEERKIASWLFYKHMTSPEFAKEWALSSGYATIRTSVLQDPGYLATMDPSNKDDKTSEEYLIAKVTQVSTGYNNRLFSSPAFKGSSAARSALGGAVTQACIAGINKAERTPDKWVEDAYNLALLSL